MAREASPRGDRGRTTRETSQRNRPTGSSTGTDERGVTPLLAAVVLFGLVTVASVGILVAGTTAVDDSKGSAETERVRAGFHEMDADVDAVARSDDRTRVTDLDLPDGTGGAVRKEDTGRIRITMTDGESTEVLVDRTIGAVEYANDGTTFAYQVGGVWRGTGADARMESAPDVVYRDGTLTFPIVDLGGDRRVASDALRVSKTRTVSPLTDVTVVEDKLVTIRIESEYYGGWAEYFRQRVTGVTVGVDHANETVVVELGRPDIEGEFAPGIVAGGGDVTVSGTGTVDSRIRAGGGVSAGPAATITCDDGTGEDCYSEDARIDRTILDWGIDRTVDAVDGSAPEPDVNAGGPATPVALDAGTYYFEDGFHLRNNDLVLDLSRGNVTLVADGNVGIGDGKRILVRDGDVNATCCYAKVYVTGDVAIANGGAGVEVVDTTLADGHDDSGNATRFQLYGTSETHFAVGQGSFTGGVYAPRDDPADGSNEAVDEYGLASATAGCPAGIDVCIGQGNGLVRGAVVAGPTSVEQATTFEYDEDLASVEPRLPLDGVVFPPELTYMHLSVHEVTLEAE